METASPHHSRLAMRIFSEPWLPGLQHATGSICLSKPGPPSFIRVLRVFKAALTRAPFAIRVWLSRRIWPFMYLSYGRHSPSDEGYPLLVTGFANPVQNNG